MSTRVESSPRDAEKSADLNQLTTPREFSLVDALNERFVGKLVRVTVNGGYEGSGLEWKGTLQRVLTNGDQIGLDMGNVILPWSQINSIYVPEK